MPGFLIRRRIRRRFPSPLLRRHRGRGRAAHHAAAIDEFEEYAGAARVGRQRAVRLEKHRERGGFVVRDTELLAGALHCACASVSHTVAAIGIALELSRGRAVSVATAPTLVVATANTPVPLLPPVCE